MRPSRRTGFPLHIAVKPSDGSGEETEDCWPPPTRGAKSNRRFGTGHRMGAIFYYAGWRKPGKRQRLGHLDALPMFGDHKPFPYIAGSGDQAFAKFSPDGKWVAYVSSETGLWEVYVAPFPWTGAKWQISNGGGTVPFWRGDGKEIVYQAMGSPFHWSAQVEGHGTSFSVGEVHTLFESDALSPNTAAAQYAITPDAQRFLEITTGDAGKLPLTVVQNWAEELKK